MILGIAGTFFGLMVIILSGSFQVGVSIMIIVPATLLFFYTLLSIFCDIADAALMGIRRGPQRRNPKTKKEQSDHRSDGRNRGRRRGPRSNS
jgi:hypothetical protein